MGKYNPNLQVNLFLSSSVLETSAVMNPLHLMFRFKAFTINKPSQLLNTDWSSEPKIVTGMFSLELQPALGESSCRHVAPLHPSPRVNTTNNHFSK